jgi:hypothetical protein
MHLGHLLSLKGNCEITLNYFLISLYCGCHIPFEIFLVVIPFSVRIILECILNKWFWNMWTAFLWL